MDSAWPANCGKLLQAALECLLPPVAGMTCKLSALCSYTHLYVPPWHLLLKPTGSLSRSSQLLVSSRPRKVASMHCKQEACSRWSCRHESSALTCQVWSCAGSHTGAGELSVELRLCPDLYRQRLPQNISCCVHDAAQRPVLVYIVHVACSQPHMCTCAVALSACQPALSCRFVLVF